MPHNALLSLACSGAISIGRDCGNMDRKAGVVGAAFERAADAGIRRDFFESEFLFIEMRKLFVHGYLRGLEG